MFLVLSIDKPGFCIDGNGEVRIARPDQQTDIQLVITLRLARQAENNGEGVRAAAFGLVAGTGLRGGPVHGRIAFSHGENRVVLGVRKIGMLIEFNG
jgi:hypothetical protein